MVSAVRYRQTRAPAGNGPRPALWVVSFRLACGYTNAEMPVTSRPTMRDWMVSVPS